MYTRKPNLCRVKHATLSNFFKQRLVVVDWTVFIAEQWVLVTILGILVTALVVVESRKGGVALTHHEITRLMNADNAVLIDIRDSKEFNAGHIAGAMNIPHTKFNSRIAELEKHKTKTIVIVDKIGQHAGTTSATLRAQGFDSKRMQGGMMDWMGQNLPVIKS